MKKRLFALLPLLALVWHFGCETRLAIQEIEFEDDLTLLLRSDSGKVDIDATKDTLTLLYEVFDKENNVISLKGKEEQISVVAKYGKIANKEKYFYPDTTESLLYDTITTTFFYNDGIDSASDKMAVTIHPKQNSIGFLPPDYINVNMRTDSVYKSGAYWKMFVDAIVSDSLGNPVEEGIAVMFTIEEASIEDTSLVSIENLTNTGDTAQIENIKSYILGEAINVFTYDSKAIGATVVIKAEVRDNPAIFDLDTLVLPVPKHNLKLMAHDRNGGLVKVKKSEDEQTAKILVTLRDAFNIPVPYHTVNISALGGQIVPNGKVYDTLGNWIGSTPIIQDSTWREECFTWDSLIVDTIYPDSINPDTVSTVLDDWKVWEKSPKDTICDPDEEPLFNYFPAYDTLPNPYSGYTNENGEFMIHIKIDSYDKPADPDINTITVPVTLVEESTHLMNSDFSFSVIFY